MDADRVTSEDARNGLTAWFAECHRACDDQWLHVEQAADAGDAKAAYAAFERFDRLVRGHLAMEEDVLFPAVEAAGLPSQGPTRVMRAEHVRMRAQLERMGRAALEGRLQEVLDEGDALNLLVQQHNEKEEGVLYPLCERLLDWPALQVRLDPYANRCGCGGCGCG